MQPEDAPGAPAVHDDAASPSALGSPSAPDSLTGGEDDAPRTGATPSPAADPAKPSDAVADPPATPPRRWRPEWTVVLICLMALAAGAVWLLTTPVRDRGAIADQVEDLLNRTLDGDAEAQAVLVESLQLTSQPNTATMAMLDRPGAEASLGTGVIAEVRAGDVVLGKSMAYAKATLRGSRTDVAFTVTLSKRGDADTWDVDSLTFPEIEVRPAGPGRPGNITFNGLTRNIPASATAVSLLVWPSDRADLSLGADGAIGWGSTSLGRVPSGPLQREGSGLTLSWEPGPLFSQESMDRAADLTRAWLGKAAQQRIASAQARPLGSQLNIYLWPPRATLRTDPKLRRLKAEVLTHPAVAFAPPGRLIASQPGAPLVAEARGARLRFTGEWLDGTTWRSFTVISTLSLEVTLDPQLTTVIRAGETP